MMPTTWPAKTSSETLLSATRPLKRRVTSVILSSGRSAFSNSAPSPAVARRFGISAGLAEAEIEVFQGLVAHQLRRGAFEGDRAAFHDVRVIGDLEGYSGVLLGHHDRHP